MKKLHCVRADAKFKPIPGTEFELTPISCCSPWASCIRCTTGMIKTLGLDLDPRGNVKADSSPIRPRNRRFRRRRHAPRPVAGGLGDPRRPPVRPRDRQVPDGIDRAAALS